MSQMFAWFPSEDLSNDFEQLSSWEKRALREWISNHVNSDMLWSHTSLGLQELFERSRQGFRIGEKQFKWAMIEAGFVALNEREREWVFDQPSPLTSRMLL
jgi:hypothetical protein